MDPVPQVPENVQDTLESHAAPFPLDNNTIETVPTDIPQEVSTQQSAGVNWLKDLHMLPKVFPGARIMGLDKEIMPSELASKESLQSLALMFIAALKANREDKKRPIIFICYGFGGIILEQVVISLEQDMNDEILPTISGILFLATPFRDATSLLNNAIYEGLGTKKEKKEIRTKVQINFGHQSLSNMLESFIKVAKRHQFEMSFFYQRDTKITHDVDFVSNHLDITISYTKALYKKQVCINRENGSLAFNPANSCFGDFRFLNKYNVSHGVIRLMA
jgi:hypothetical protein